MTVLYKIGILKVHVTGSGKVWKFWQLMEISDIRTESKDYKAMVRVNRNMYP